MGAPLAAVEGWSPVCAGEEAAPRSRGEAGEKAAAVKSELAVVRSHRYCVRICWSAGGKWRSSQLAV